MSVSLSDAKYAEITFMILFFAPVLILAVLCAVVELLCCLRKYCGATAAGRYLCVVWLEVGRRTLETGSTSFTVQEVVVATKW